MIGFGQHGAVDALSLRVKSVHLIAVHHQFCDLRVRAEAARRQLLERQPLDVINRVNGRLGFGAQGRRFGAVSVNRFGLREQGQRRLPVRPGRERIGRSASQAGFEFGRLKEFAKFLLPPALDGGDDQQQDDDQRQ